jgi:hypothetical protein
MFKNCKTVADVKSRYRELCFQLHPDVSGWDSTEKMKDLNETYHRELKSRNGETKTYKGRKYTYRYNSTRESALMETLAKIIRAQLPPEITVKVVGIYIWISGTRKGDLETRKKLRKAKFIWHGRRKRWFWKPEDYRSRYNRKATFQDLEDLFGSRTIRDEEPLLTG